MSQQADPHLDELGLACTPYQKEIDGEQIAVGITDLTTPDAWIEVRYD